MRKKMFFVVFALEICIIVIFLVLVWAGLLAPSDLRWVVVAVLLLTVLEVMLLWNGKTREQKPLGRTIAEWVLAGVVLVYLYLRHFA